jgi:hypothetical protein
VPEKRGGLDSRPLSPGFYDSAAKTIYAQHVKSSLGDRPDPCKIAGVSLGTGKERKIWIRGGFVEGLFGAWRLGSGSGSGEFCFFEREGGVVAFLERRGDKA